METLTLKEIQEIGLGLLLAFDSTCRQNSLRYSLGGGSLLGAVRHKGFIPWDDDVDVIMPRPDYEKLLKLCREGKAGLDLIAYDTADRYNGLYAKIWDPSTVIKDDLTDVSFEIGVNIDVFPVDGLGNSEREAFRIFRKTAWKREVLNAVLWKKFFRSRTHGILFEPIRLIMFVISRFVDPKKLLRKIDEENLSHPFEQSSYAGCVCGSYREKEIMAKEIFENYIDLEFEGHRVKGIRNYDEYLRKLYSRYMELPPKDRQKSHHTYKAYRI